MWDLRDLCECFAAQAQPSVRELLDSLQRGTVCTATQCFEESSDLTGATAQVVTHVPVWLQAALFVAAVLLAAATMPAQGSGKPTAHAVTRSPREGA